MIPARGGSQRIPLKNIRTIGGMPAIAYSIAAAVQSGCFARVVVSTDSQEIAAIAQRFGADVPFIREASLSDDHARISDVVRDAILQIDPNQQIYPACCCVFATAPLLKADTLFRAKQILSKTGAQYVVPVVPFGHPPRRALSVREDHTLNPIFETDFDVRTQDHSEAFHDSGQFYYGRIKAWINEQPILGVNSYALKMHRNEAIDIDDEESWALAEFALQRMTSK